MKTKMNILKMFLLSTLVVLFTACNSSSTGDSTVDDAINKIADYAQNGGTPPTLQDYLDAGVTGITNVDEINTIVEGLTKEDVDTTEEIQALANQLGVVIEGNVPPVAKAYASKKTISLGEEIFFNSTHSVDTDGSIVSYKWTDNGQGLAKVPSFTMSNFTVGTHTVTLTVTDNDGATSSDNITITVTAAEEAQSCVQAAGYETVELSNGNVWLDRSIGASSVGGVGTYYTAVEASGACPCGFSLPLFEDTYVRIGIDFSALNFANGGYIGFAMTAPAAINLEEPIDTARGYYWQDAPFPLITQDGIIVEPFFPQPLNNVQQQVRCIDPATRVLSR